MRSKMIEGRAHLHTLLSYPTWSPNPGLSLIRARHDRDQCALQHLLSTSAVERRQCSSTSASNAQIRIVLNASAPAQGNERSYRKTPRKSRGGSATGECQATACACLLDRYVANEAECSTLCHSLLPSRPHQYNQ